MASSDGKVVIDVILDDGTVAKGIANIDKRLGGLTGSGKRAALGIKQIAGALGLVAIASKAINAVKNSLDSAISRYDTLTGFPVVMQQMGFSAEQSKKSIDKLASGIEGLPTTLDGIVSSTKRIALLTGDLDTATDTALALNNAFLASGSSAADAERGLTQYVQMLSKGKVDSVSWMTLQETMGYALRETAAAFGYAGSSATNDLYKALQSGTITFDQFNAKLIELSNKTGGFTEVAKSSTSGIATSFSNMKNAVVKGVANVIAAIDQTLGGTGSIAGYLDKLKVGINAAFNGIVKVIPIVADGLRTIGSLFSPLIPIVQNFGNQIKSALSDKVGQAISFAQSAISKLKTFWEQNGQSILNNAITYFEGIWTVVSTVFNNVYSIVSSLLGSQIIPFIKQQLDFIKQFWDQNGQQIMQAVKNCFNFIKSVVEFVMPAVKFIIDMVWSAIADIIGGAIKVITGLIQVFTAIFTGDWKQLWEGTKKIISGAIQLILGWMSLSFFGGIKKIFANLLKNGVSVVKSMWSQIVNFFKNFGTNLTNIASNLVTKVISYFTNLLNKARNIFGTLRTFGASIWSALRQAVANAAKQIFDVVKTRFSSILSTTKSIFSSIRTFISTILSAVSSIFKNYLAIYKNLVTGNFRGIVSNIKNILGSVKTIVSTVFGRVISYLKSINLTSIGKNIMQGLIRGIGSMASAVVDKVKNIGKSISGGLKKVLDIHSPSRVTTKIGEYTGQGLVNGLNNKKKTVKKSAKDLANEAIKNLETKFDTGKISTTQYSGITNRLRNASLSIAGVSPIGAGNVATSSTNVNNDNSKHFSLQVTGGTSSEEIAAQTEKTLKRMIFEMG